MLDTVKNWFKTFSVAGNLEKIKEFLSTAYSALQKVMVFASYIKDELEKNNVGANILKVLPSVLSVLGTIVSLIAKFGPIFGVNLPVGVPTNKKVTAEELTSDLNEELEKLKKV